MDKDGDAVEKGIPVLGARRDMRVGFAEDCPVMGTDNGPNSLAPAKDQLETVNDIPAYNTRRVKISAMEITRAR